MVETTLATYDLESEFPINFIQTEFDGNMKMIIRVEGSNKFFLGIIRWFFFAVVEYRYSFHPISGVALDSDFLDKISKFLREINTYDELSEEEKQNFKFSS